MAILQTVSAWLTGIIGLLALLSGALWLVEKVFDYALLLLRIRKAFFEFLFRREKCTCGAVGPKRKAVSVDLPGAPPKEGQHL